MSKLFSFPALLLVLSTACSSQEKAPQKLISRKTFFQASENHSFKVNAQGTVLYYIHSTAPDYIQSLDIKTGEKDSIEYTGLKGWEPMENGPLAWTQDSLGMHLNYAENGELRDITLPKNTSRCVLLKTSSESTVRAALELFCENQDLSGIYVLNGEQMTLKKKYDLQDYPAIFLDNDFTLTAAHGPNDLGGNSIYLYDRTEEKWNEFTQGEFGVDMFLGGFTKVVGVSNDAGHIYFTSNKETDKSQLYSLDTKNSKIEQLTESEKVDILPFAFSTNKDGEVTSVVGLFAKTLRHCLDKETQSDFDWLEKKLEGDVGFIQAVDNDNKWLVREFLGGIAKVYLYNRESKELSYLLSSRPELEDEKLARRHAFAVTAHDGLELPVHVYLPAGSDANGDGIPDKPLPTVMYVHGGPWAGITMWNGYFHCRNFQLLANRGYAVINCEFRGSTGLGKEFVDKSIKTWGTDMTRDKVDIAQWAIDKDIANKEKIGIWGWSYGGYAALAGVAFHPDQYACAVSMYGITDLYQFCQIPFADNDFWRDMVGDYKTDAEMLQSYSPINYVDAIKSPVLLTTGSKDERVPQEQVGAMAKALKASRKEVVYFYYPEEVHDYRKPESWMSFWAITEKFLADNLGGAYEPVGNDLENGNFVAVEGKDFIEQLN